MHNLYKQNSSNLVRIFLIVLMAFIIAQLQAQEIKKEVYVVSAFEPIIDEAEKISPMPAADDTVRLRPTINYSVMPSKIETDYELRPIKAATMVGTPLDKLYKSYLKAGIGNYTSPLLEFSIHNLRSKEYAVGAYLYHKSSYTKLALENDHKVPAGYGINRISAYGKRFYKKVNVSGDVEFNTDRLRHYGYNVNNFTDSLPPMEKSDIKQSFLNVKATTSVYSVEADSGAFQYRVDLGVDYFGDHYSGRESAFSLAGSMKVPIKSFQFGLDAGYDLYAISEEIGNTNTGVLHLRPYFKKRSAEWEISLGAQIYNISAAESDFHIFPEASIRFQVIPDVLITYFGATGSMEINNFQKIAWECNYYTPGLNVGNTKHRLVGYGGLEGKISSKAGYRIDVRFDAMENAYFFVNDTISMLENTFEVTHDDVDRVRYYGEVYYKPLNELTFFLKSAFNTYQLAGEAKPWHKSLFDLTFTTSYTFKEKISAQVDLLYYGKRYAKDLSLSDDIKELDPIFDLNLRLEYKYSGILSAFVDVYNLASQKYYWWNNYPNQRINVMVGFTYKL